MKIGRFTVPLVLVFATLAASCAKGGHHQTITTPPKTVASEPQSASQGPQLLRAAELPSVWVVQPLVSIPAETFACLRPANLPMPNQTRHEAIGFAAGPNHFPTFAEGIHVISRDVSAARASLEKIERACHYVTNAYQGRSVDGFSAPFEWQPASDRIEAWKIIETVTEDGRMTREDSYTLLREFPGEIIVLEYSTYGGGNLTELRYLARLAFGEARPGSTA
jgi:hypothetical protein